MGILDDVGLGGGGTLGGYTSAMGDVIGGVGAYASGRGSADALTAAAKREENATAIRLVQKHREGYMIQGKAEAAIGAQGWSADSGSAAAILRMNASNLALDNGIIQAAGSERASAFTTAASAAKSSATSGIIKAAIGAVGIIAAPFTGGASLAIAGVAAGAV
jgi:hypothetical protein